MRQSTKQTLDLELALPAPPFTILGGGAAGLMAAWSLVRRGGHCLLLEKSSVLGGNAITFRHGPFRYDSGAHRFHDKDPEVTKALLALMPGKLKRIHMPSQILDRGQRFDFPLTPLNLVGNLGAVEGWRALRDWLQRPLLPDSRSTPSFRSGAEAAFGVYIAERFLCRYSEKLWGTPAHLLSPAVAGSRIKGLTASGLVREALLGKRRHIAHLDGAFLYPRDGIGDLVDALSREIEQASATAPVPGWGLRRAAPTTRLFHREGRITAIEVADSRQRQPVQEVISTLPITHVVRMLDPAPEAAILAAVSALRFRHMVLLALFLDVDRVSNHGSLYFPDQRIPFTRACEPKNRSAAMAPVGKSSLVLEIPCQRRDPFWTASTEELTATMIAHLEKLQLVRASAVTGAASHHMVQAYPILDLASIPALATLRQYLGGFANLHLFGRNGTFTYLHLHDLFRQAGELADRLANPSGPPGVALERAFSCIDD
ncbi:MAG: NAD(P)-binding protein [Magnetococcales bacterium]|nr:NAD(P)-binding protein [Magnetococcales bacterium]